MNFDDETERTDGETAKDDDSFWELRTHDSVDFDAENPESATAQDANNGDSYRGVSTTTRQKITVEAQSYPSINWE